MHSKTKNTKMVGTRGWRVLASIAFLGIAAYVLAKHWHIVSTSLHIARNAQVSWLLTALGLMAVTMLLAAGIYGVLAVHRLRYFQTVSVEIAAGFVNRILPGGLGSLGLHGVYLYHRKHTVAEATAVVSVNNLLGITAHLSLLLVLAVAHSHVVRALNLRFDVALFWWVGVAIVTAAVGICSLRTVRLRMLRFLPNLLVSLRKVGMWNALRAYGLAIALTVTYTALLLCSARSVGLRVNALEIFIVFTAGMFSGTIVPLPGGLVGAEAGLLTGFIAYDVPTAQAGAAVLVFRLVTYWLPIIPGLLALLWARQRKLV